jgi:beta-phosphoglucomutase-like phosphatase (HAD superfamily)
MIARFGELDPSRTRALLCDADGTLFGSEEPAYDASAGVVNRLLAELGAERSYVASELQAMTNGKNFRAGAQQLAASYGRELDAETLSRWTAEEKDVVTAHLREVLTPDPSVSDALAQLAQRFVLAVVTSSATSRLNACLEVTRLSELLTPELRFSAEDSLPEPTSKPDPAIYAFAGRRLGITPDEGIALEDSINGALSSVAAGYPTIGIVAFVPADQRAARTQALREAGVVAVVSAWPEIPELLVDPSRT